MRMYHQRCLALVPNIRAVAAKWTFEDLIPGLSDFDTRFILDDGMATADWSAMSLAVGQVHTQMAHEFPRWARNLEHLPGLNLTVSEVTDPRLFYPEFQQWTLYEGDPRKVEVIESYLNAHVWSPADELYHLKKFATFCGPYQRGIDPPVNLGPWESKYPLHSRFMHYFAPPVQAAVSLVQRRNVRGKFEALRLARVLFPNPHVIDLLLDVVLARHYEVPELYEEPCLGELERALEGYLADAWASLEPHLTLVKPAHSDSRGDIRRKVATLPVDPVQTFFEGVKFSRLMKGRLLFYAQDILWFDSAWLVRNELGRIAANFHDKPLSIYGRVRFGRTMTPAEVLDAIRSDVITSEEADGMSRFAEVARRPTPPGQEKAHARAVADVYDHVLAVIEKLSADLMARIPEARCGT